MKRFTETEKWNDPWFRKLPPAVKCLWNYLCDRCDPAGVIELDLALAGFHVGHDFCDADMAFLEGRLEQIREGKWRISKFLEFQYGVLDWKCRGQHPAIKAVLKHGISYPIQHLPDNLSHRVSHTLQDNTGQDRTGLRQEEAPGARARVYSPGEWAELICQAYCRGDSPVECLQAIAAELDRGTDPAMMLEKVQACTANIRKHAPGGPSNHKVPGALSFFSGKKWTEPDIYAQRWADVAKKEGPPPAQSVNPYEVPPCAGWKELARRIAQRLGMDESGLDQLDWRELAGEDRLAVWAEWKKENSGGGNV